jgi:hypothetical protein
VIGCEDGQEDEKRHFHQSTSVAAAAATAAAASAAGEGLGVAVAGAVGGAEDGELEGVLFSGALGAGDFLLLVDYDFLEVGLAVFADVFVDGHDGSLATRFDYSRVLF